jgi:outer membrane protein
MKKIIITTLALVLFASASAHAQWKEGYVDLKRIITESAPGLQAKETLRSKYQPQMMEIQALKSRVESMRQDLAGRAATMTREEAMEKEVEINSLTREYQAAMKSYQRKLQSEEEKLTDPIFEKAIEVIRTYGDQNGYASISDMAASGLIYAAEANDLTTVIIEELNKAWRAQN